MKKFRQFAEGREDWVYHGTDVGRHESIKKHGLRPNEHGNPVNFHDDHRSARYYSGRDENSMFLRVRRSDLPPHRHQAATGHSWTSHSVHPDKIQMRAGRRWKKL